MPVIRLRRAALAAATVTALASIGLAPAAARAAQNPATTRATAATTGASAPSAASSLDQGSAATTAPLGSAATLPHPLLAGRGSTPVCGEYGHCLARILTRAPGSDVPLTAGVPEGYGPADFAAAYGLPAGVGHSGTIAILDQGSFPTLAETLGVYRSTFGLPPCTAASGCFKQVGERGGAPLAPATTLLDQVFDQEVGVETTLDTEMASAACPMCKILEITLPRGDDLTNDQLAEDFGVAMNTAARLGAKAASVSYQFPPDATLDLGQAARDFYHPGMAITASSGDGGYESGGPDRAPDGWPQDLPTVTSVGGTSLYRTPGTARGYTEVAWDEAGSGCGSDLPPALGQPSAVSAVCGGHRAGSDVSADADVETGAAVYDDYAPASHEPDGWIVVGGTSESSPFIAGVYARGGHLAGVEGPSSLYADPAADFNDVTAGQNTVPNSDCATALCIAGPGWDGPSGLGTPNGLAGF